MSDDYTRIESAWAELQAAFAAAGQLADGDGYGHIEEPTDIEVGYTGAAG